MKKMLGLTLLVLTVGLFAGCEEEHEHHRHEGYGRPPGPVIGQGYYYNGYYYDNYGRRIEH